MEHKTQLEMIKQRLIEDGYISRNWCLRNYIGRLASRMDDLHREGWQTEGSFIKTDRGLDYIYKLIRIPDKSYQTKLVT